MQIINPVHLTRSRVPSYRHQPFTQLFNTPLTYQHKPHRKAKVTGLEMQWALKHQSTNQKLALKISKGLEGWHSGTVAASIAPGPRFNPGSHSKVIN